MKNYVQSGQVIDYVAGSNITSGAVVIIGTIIGVAVTDIASGETGSVAIAGVFNLPKVSGDTITAGEALVWDASAAAFADAGTTLATGDVSKCCVAVGAAGPGTTTVPVLLNVGVGTVT